MTLRKLIENNYNDMEALIDSIKVGIFITDGNGNVLILNKESEKSGGLSKKDQVGKNIRDLIEQGYITESSVTKVLNSKREENIIQQLGDGSQVYITGSPIMKHWGIELVVCTERDITETKNLEKLLKQNIEITEKYKEELQVLRNHFETGDEAVAVSYNMKSVIEKALKLAKLNTTVLITGESGTGKELLVKMIHKNSNRSQGPFIKINCAARITCWSQNFLVMKRVPSQEPLRKGNQVFSSLPIMARCFWMKSESCLWSCRQKCSECSRKGKS